MKIEITKAEAEAERAGVAERNLNIGDYYKTASGLYVFRVIEVVGSTQFHFTSSDSNFSKVESGAGLDFVFPCTPDGQLESVAVEKVRFGEIGAEKFCLFNEKLYQKVRCDDEWLVLDFEDDDYNELVSDDTLVTPCTITSIHATEGTTP